MQQPFLRVLTPLVIFLGLSGCVIKDYEQGTRVSAQHLASFVKGKTTRNEVVAVLGGPQDIQMDGGKEILTDRYQKIAAYGPNEGTDTTLIFNSTGVLEDVLQSSGTGLPHPLTGR
jgi:hypothetical protein